MTEQEHYYLFLMEVGGIQDFIFASNNLQINIGASALVRSVTDVWIKELLQSKSTNFDNIKDKRNIALNHKQVERDNLDAEIVYIGGGNALILFSKEDDISIFMQELSRKSLLEAPGINLDYAHVSLSLSEDNFKEKFSELRKILSIKKAKITPPPRIMGLGVSARCVFSGKPASGIWKDPGSNSMLVSDEVIKKLGRFKLGEQFLKELFDSDKSSKPFAFITNFDDFGEKGTSSYIAIVHADGNRMGERIKSLGNEFSFPKDNYKYISLLRDFSRSSKNAANEALRLTIQKLIDSIQTEDGEFFIQRKHDVLPEKVSSLPKVIIKSNKLPFRPIVFGGDDVTFICDGRLGLSLAKEYLVNYGNQILGDEKPAVGRAGVAITPSHFPFSRGYDLAEELSGYAKNAGHNGEVQSIDWHFGTNGIVESISAIRDRSYKVKNGDLSMRPVKLSDSGDYDFLTFEYLVKEFQVGKDWATKRNKVKHLIRLLREGGDSVFAFLNQAHLDNLPVDIKIENLFGLKTKGWFANKCYYFDALEAVDFHIPLEV